MPLSPQERAELEALRAEHGVSNPDSPGVSAPTEDQAPEYGSAPQAALEGFGNRASFGNLSKLQGWGEKAANAVFGDPSAQADAEVMRKLGPGTTIMQPGSEGSWDTRQKQLEQSNPVASGLGGLAGDVASGIALGGVGGRLINNPLTRAAAEGAVSGGLDPNGSVVGGALGGSAMQGVGSLASKALRGAGGISRSVGQFNDTLGSAEKAAAELAAAKQGVYGLGAPARAEKEALLQQLGPVADFAPGAAEDATRRLVPSAEADALRRQAYEEAKAVNRGGFATPEMAIKGTKMAQEAGARGAHFTEALNNASPELAGLNKEISGHANLSGALDEFKGDPLRALLGAKRGTENRAVLEKVQKEVGGGLLPLANQLQQGKRYSIEGIGDAISSPAKTGILGASMLADKASRGADKVNGASLRNILLNLSRDRAKE